MSGGKQNERKTERRARHSPARQADAEVCPAMHRLAAGRGALQHRRPDLYRLGRRLSRQRRDERRVSPDRSGACRHDRRRRVQLCVDLLRQESAGERKPRRRQRRDAERAGGHRSCGALCRVPDAASDAVRRDGGEFRLCEGIFHLHHHRHSHLCLRTGDQPHHPLGRQPAVRHVLHAGGCGRELHSGPDRDFCSALGRDGRSRRNGGRTGHHGGNGRMVPAPHKGAAPESGRFQTARENSRRVSAAGSLQLPCADLAGHRHGRDEQYAGPIRRFQQIRRRYPADGARHRDEGLSDHHLHHHWHGRRLHSHRGI